MHKVTITATGVLTPQHAISNQELVQAFNAYADLQNIKHATAIEAGERDPISHSSEKFILSASGIESRYVWTKEGILDPKRMYPLYPERNDDEPSLMAEVGTGAALEALNRANINASDINLVICAASNMERAYPAIAVEIQKELGASGMAFDMNVACSSATFGIQTAADMIRSGSINKALVISPEVTSGHLEWRDRDCHFIFGDVATAVLLERSEEAADGFEVLSTRCATQFSNNIRNNNGFLRRTRNAMEDRRDMQFMQNGRKVFKEVLPIVSNHISEHISSTGFQSSDMKRLWLHQANKSMNDYIGKKVMGQTPSPSEQPNILQDYGNTSSAGSIIAFDKHSADLSSGDLGLICSFGAGYSVGSVIVRRQ